MRLSQLFTRTERQPPVDEPSANARWLLQAGYIDRTAAGIFTYLPLGLAVLARIQQIVREEMLAIGGQEILMPALHPMEPWATTGRWQDPGPAVMFQFTGRGGQHYGLGWTHEEIVTPLVQRYVRSYRDLPFAVFQIQDKFRNEPRAKSGLLRGREFSMKDLYSFHRDEADLEVYYQRVAEAYQQIFRRCGLTAVLTEASGGAFSRYSHEFQVVTPSGEDIIFRCGQCGYAQNREVSQFAAGDLCPKCTGQFVEERAIEVGNIFKLGTRFSEAFGCTFLDAAGEKRLVWMGCYGIGPSRVMGAIAEIHQDERGLRWPLSVAPFGAHLVQLGKDGAARQRADALYERLCAAEIATLYDDRTTVSVGEKFNDADLIGLPWRVVVSPKTGEQVELKARAGEAAELISVKELLARLSAASTA